MRNEIGLAVVIAALVAGPAPAQNLDLSELAAALALPIVTGGQAPNPLTGSAGDIILADDSAITLATVTNARSTPVLLRVDAISGDPGGPLGGDLWGTDSFQCLLSGRETTTFLIVPNGAGSLIYVECSTEFATDGIFARRTQISARAQNGILWVAAADPASWDPVSEDILFGDAVVIDTQVGLAYSFGAIAFQAGTGANDGNKVFRFDGQEYARWPSTVATNFLVAVPNGGPAGLLAELILFTLDGKTGNPVLPRVSVSGLAFDDDENAFDFSHVFDCFDIVSLEDLSANFALIFPNSPSGHLMLVPQQVGTGSANDVHDQGFGDGNGVRRRPVHGWIAQAIPANVGLAAGPVAWGRPLAQGRGALVPFLADGDPVFDAGPF